MFFCGILRKKLVLEKVWLSEIINYSHNSLILRIIHTIRSILVPNTEKTIKYTKVKQNSFYLLKLFIFHFEMICSLCSEKTVMDITSCSRKIMRWKCVGPEKSRKFLILIFLEELRVLIKANIKCITTKVRWTKSQRKQANGIQIAVLFILENPSIFEVTISTLSVVFIMNWKRLLY